MRRILLAILAALPLVADAAGTRVGALTCEAVEGTRINLLVHSSVDVVCTFVRDDGTKEVYKGESGIAFGLDLSFRKNEQFAFTVVSSSKAGAGEHPLAGKYVGVTAKAAAGLGLGASTLVGGSDDSFGLEPLAMEINNGFGVAGGIGYLYLEPM